MVKEWYVLPEKEVIKKLDSSDKGLDNKKAQDMLEKHGENILKKTAHFNGLKIFFNQFKSFLILILIFAAVVSFLIDSKLDAFIIFLIIFLNAFVGFFQEYKAEKAIENLKKMIVTNAKVLRDGVVVSVDSKYVVPGDVLILEEGDKIVADARILKSDGLKINEASLTGESVSVEKFVKLFKKEVSLSERVNMVYQGTNVVSGSGLALVVNTGMNTEFGKISALVQTVESEKIPLKDKLDKFAKNVGIFILILSGIIIALLIFLGADVFQSFLVAVSLAVSAIPEGLPAIISLGLAFATRRMIKKNVLIRRLSASETLGRVSVICTDKTGTLTEEKMKVSSVYINGKLNPPKGESNKNFLFKIGVLCNNSRFGEKDGKSSWIGDPTESALMIVAKENFLDIDELLEDELKIKTFAFNSERKMMSIVRKSEKGFVSYVKGAPEKIISKSSFELINGVNVRLTDKRKIELSKVYENMAKNGLRVLGFACKNLKNDFVQDDAENDLVFVGFQGMIDPPRPEVKGAIKLCKSAGIKVLMITGDSKLTAEAVAKEIGLKGESVGSDELKEMSDKELLKRIDKIVVFSRIAPEDKLRIIDVLKKKGEVVAMTGDGVNDSLALKRADIGVSMGIRGTDVARDSSDIILVDDNFASIVEGVKEGRRVFDNIQKFVKYLLSANFYEVFFVLVVMLIFRNPELLPFLPLQILWINLVTDSLPALALSSEGMEKNVMSRKPNQEGILKNIKGFIFFSGLVGIILIGIVFFIYMKDIDKARTMVVTSSVVYQMFLVFNCKSSKSVFKSGFNAYLVYAVLFSIGLHLIVLYSSVGKWFGFVSIGLNDWLLILGICIIGFFMVEGYKVFEKRLRN